MKQKSIIKKKHKLQNQLKRFHPKSIEARNLKLRIQTIKNTSTSKR